MDFKKYETIFMPVAIKEMEAIYKYIKFNLKEKYIAENLIKKIEDKIQLLEYTPRIYPKIEKIDELGRRFRKIVIKHYIILYTIEENKKEVYISHIFYKKSDYLNKI